MITVAVPTVSWDASTSIQTMIDAAADGVDLPVNPGPPDVFTVPDGAKELKLIVRPVPSEWWRADIVLAVAPDGTLTLKDRGDAVRVDVQSLSSGMARVAKIVVRLSRVKVVSDQIIAACKRLPPLVTLPAGTDARTRLFADIANNDRQLALKVLLNGTPPFDGQQLRLPPLGSLLTIDPATPVSGGRLKFARKAVAPSNTTFVVEVAGDSIVPRTIAVSWPDDLDRATPAPMYVYYRHAPAQETDRMVGKYNTSLDPYPYSFDYAFFCLLTSLWYPYWPDSLPEFGQGVPYQIEAAGKKVVTIAACPTVFPNNKSTQFGDWTDPTFMQSILLEIQALAAALAGKPAPTSLGRVALGAFSSSHWHLLKLLEKGKGHPFLTGSVKECYLFDPDNLVLPDLMPHLLAWEGGVAGGAAVIRLYNHGAMKEQKPLISPVPTSSPQLATSSVGNRTVLVAGRNDWELSLASARGKPYARSWAWPDEHFAIAAFMLTHAIANSGF